MDFDKIAEEEGWAPHDPEWHKMYIHAIARFQRDLDRLKEHPAFHDAEDLGDWVDCMVTLMSFYPHTSSDLEREIREAYYTDEDRETIEKLKEED